MQIERVEITPRKDVFNPGDVINIAIYFLSPFVGQLSVGLVPKDHRFGEDFTRSTFAKSNNRLYEGQLYIKEDDIGTRVLRAILVPVNGRPATVAVGDQIFEIRPLVPVRR